MRARSSVVAVLFLVLVFPALSQGATSTSVACSGDGGGVSGLIAAIGSANLEPSADTIELAEGCVYTLTEAAECCFGAEPSELEGVGLPAITTPITIEGHGATIQRQGAAPAFRLFVVTGDGDLTLHDLTLRGGSVLDTGGNILSFGALTATRVSILGGSAEWGGGVYTKGTSTFTQARFENNYAEEAGGALLDSAGTTTLDRSLLTANTGGPGAITAGSGTRLRIVSSTIADHAGWALHLADTSTQIESSTIARNQVGIGSFGAPADSISVRNSVLGHNEIPEGSRNCLGADPIVDLGHNVEDGDLCGFSGTSLSNTEPLIDQLRDNGGNTLTIAPLKGSPLVDAGDDAACRAAGSADQRGLPRSEGAACEIGALEVRTSPIEVICSPSDLRGAIAESEAEPGSGSVSLAEDCVYEFFAADNGNAGDANALPPIASTLTIEGNGATLRGEPEQDFRLLSVLVTGRLSASGLTFDRGRGVTQGGGLRNAGRTTLTDVTFQRNSAQYGGAIFSIGWVAVHRGVFIESSGEEAIRIAGTEGGGLLANVSVWGSGCFFIFCGGTDGVWSNQTVHLMNSTIAFNGGSGLVSPAFPNGGIFHVHNSILDNPIIRNVARSNCVDVLLEAESHNVEAGDTCGFSSANGSHVNVTQPVNQPDPSGHLVLTGGSPAVDRGDAAVCADAEAGAGGVDGRGVARPQGAACDIGAYENRPPGAPGIPGGPAISRGGFELAWEAASDPDPSDTIAYDLQATDADDPGFSGLATGLAEPKHAFTAGDPAEGTWTYRVRASDGNHTSAWVASGDLKVDRSAPHAPMLVPQAPDVTVAGVPWHKDEGSFEVQPQGDPALPDGSAGSWVDPDSFTSPVVVTENGSTTHRQRVEDRAGNASDLSEPLAMHVDARPPAIALGPCPPHLVLGARAEVDLSATDGESGVAGLPSPALDTEPVGAKTFRATVRDRVWEEPADDARHAATATCDYEVTYATRDGHDPGAGVPAGTDALVLVFLEDAAARNVSSPSIGVRRPGGEAFTYRPGLGAYELAIPTHDLAPGVHQLAFLADGDPVVHRTSFTVTEAPWCPKEGTRPVCGSAAGDHLRIGGEGKTIHLGPGDDDLITTGCPRLVVGGAGADGIEVPEGCGTMIRGGRGDDQVFASPGVFQRRGLRTGVRARGGPGDDLLVGGRLGDVLRGGAGTDVLRGSRGPDNLRGGPGIDRIVGGPDNDRCGSRRDLRRGCP